MNNVRFIFPYSFPIIRQLKNEKKLIWNDYQFYLNDELEKYDFLVVFDHVNQLEKVNCPMGHKLLITGESHSIKQYPQIFLDQFDYVVTCQEQIKHKGKINSHHGYPWHIEQSYQFLKDKKEIEKVHDMVLISSNKGYSEGHLKRLTFSYKCKNEFERAVDFYGRGIRSFDSKWDIISKYSFSLVIENDYVKNYFTEKIIDSFLALSLPIYYGCPNLKEFFPVESFIPIDINNFAESKEIVQQTLTNKKEIYKQRFDALVEAKKRVLEEHQFFPMVCNILSTIRNQKEIEKVVTIQNTSQTKFNILNSRIKRYYYSKKASRLADKIAKFD